MTGASGRGPVTDLLAGDQSRYCLGFNLNVTLNPGPIRGPGEPRGWHDDDGVYCCQFSRRRQSWAPYTLLRGEEEEEEVLGWRSGPPPINSPPRRRRR